MDYRFLLREQLINAQIPGKRRYYEYLYNIIASHLPADGEILEIGCGAGVSKLFLPDIRVVRTDFLDWEENDLLGSIDAQNLPFQDEAFAAIFGVDMLHHVPEPFKVVTESLRVVAQNGVVIFVEPFISPFSYLFYKIFHPEDTTLGLTVEPGVPIFFETQLSGDQIIAQKVFLRGENLSAIKKLTKVNLEIEILYLSPLSFFATGGLNSRFALGPRGIKTLISVESLLGQTLLKLMGSRAVYVLRKLP
jgi:SAM-dependent methyltransferase